MNCIQREQQFTDVWMKTSMHMSHTYGQVCRSMGLCHSAPGCNKYHLILATVASFYIQVHTC